MTFLKKNYFLIVFFTSKNKPKHSLAVPWRTHRAKRVQGTPLSFIDMWHFLRAARATEASLCFLPAFYPIILSTRNANPSKK